MKLHPDVEELLRYNRDACKHDHVSRLETRKGGKPGVLGSGYWVSVLRCLDCAKELTAEESAVVFTKKIQDAIDKTPNVPNLTLESKHPPTCVLNPGVETVIIDPWKFPFWE